MRILVSGATGLLGRAFLETTGKNDEVFFISRKPAEMQDHECINLDLSSPWRTSSLPSQMDVIVHLAQSSEYRKFPSQAHDIFSVNVSSTAKLLDYASNAGVQKFLLASTGGIYRGKGRPVSEESEILGPSELGYYFASKLSSEMLAANYRDWFEVNILRIFFMYGINQKIEMFLPSIIKKISSGVPVRLDGPNGIRINPIHASVAASAMHQVIQRGGPRTINLAGAEIFSIREISELIGKFLGVEPRYEIFDKLDDLIADTTQMMNFVENPTKSFSSLLPSIIEDVIKRH
jgi:nucleoside-diphosphate-sugar epimerase